MTLIEILQQCGLKDYVLKDLCRPDAKVIVKNISHHSIDPPIGEVEDARWNNDTKEAELFIRT